MTRLAILGDIHGNLPALEAVWADLQQFDVDLVVVAGDSIGFGPHSLEVLEFLDTQPHAFIRGNHELYVLDYQSPRWPEAWHDVVGDRLTGPRWIHHLIGNTWRTRIAGWPDTLCLRFADAVPLRVVHGIPGDHWKGIYPDTTDRQIADILADIEETTVVAAHTHLPLDREVDRWHVVNPGAVGNPANGIQDASYALLLSDGDQWHATHRRVAFDRQPVVDDLLRQNSVADHGDFGELVVEEFRTGEQYVGPYMRWRLTCFPDLPMSTSLIDRFTENDRLQHTAAVYLQARSRQENP